MIGPRLLETVFISLTINVNSGYSQGTLRPAPVRRCLHHSRAAMIGYEPHPIPTRLADSFHERSEALLGVISDMALLPMGSPWQKGRPEKLTECETVV